MAIIRQSAWADIAKQLREHHMRNPEEYSPCFRKKEDRKEMILPKDGEFYAAQTLLGCEPGSDRNRRHVYCWPSDVPILVMNEWLNEWTPEHQSRLDVILKALNDAEPK